MIIVLLAAGLGLFCPVTSGYGQTIENVQVSVKDDKVIVDYDLVHTNAQAWYKISLRFQGQTGQTIKPKSVSGDIGYVKGGKNQTIIWDVDEDQDALFTKIKPVLKIEDQFQKLGGPEYAPLSILVPGLGAHFVEKKKMWPLNVTRTVVVWGVTGFGVLQKFRSDNLYDDYLNAKEQSEIDRLYNKANKFHKQSYYLLRTGAVLWAADLIWTTMEGLINLERNKKLQEKHNIDVGINYQQDVMTVGLKYRF